jgi:hypothetical protein
VGEVDVDNEVSFLLKANGYSSLMELLLSERVLTIDGSSACSQCSGGQIATAATRTIGEPFPQCGKHCRGRQKRRSTLKRTWPRCI